MARFTLESVIPAAPAEVFAAMFLRAYMRRLILERNAILAAEFEDPGRTLPT